MRGQLVDECVVLKRGEASSGQNKNLPRMGGHLVHLGQEGESDAERKTPSWFRQQQETNQMALLSCECRHMFSNGKGG